MNAWSLPAGQRFITHLSEKAETQQFCVAVLPEIMDTVELAEEFSRHMYQEGLGVCSIIHATPDKPFTHSIHGNKHGNTNNDAFDFDELLNTPIDGSFLIIIVPDKRCVAAQTMNTAIRELATSAKRKKDVGVALNWTLLVIAPARLPLPESDASLDILCWQGKWRRADLELAFDESLRTSPPENDALGWWLYALCLGIGTTDPSLCSELFRETPQDIPSLIALLQRHPIATAAKLANRTNIITCDDNISSRPGPIRKDAFLNGTEKLDLWGKGILDLDDSGALVIHPAALAQVKRTTSLERMVCRGQQQVFLPLQHSVLRILHQKLFDTFGNNWHKKSGDSDYDSALYDIGPLQHYIKKFLPNCPSEIKNTAYAWRDVRHAVAHNTLLPFEKLYIAMEYLRHL